MNTSYRKIVSSTVLGILVLVILGIFVVYKNDNPTGTPTVILRNFNPRGGAHFILYGINQALYACEKSKHKLVVLLDSGLYKEDRSHFIADNPYYNEYDWLSYYFEPINQTDKPLKYWKKWAKAHPFAKVVTTTDLREPVLKTKVPYAERYSPKILFPCFDYRFEQYYGILDNINEEFHRIWHKYFKLRPHVQKIVDDFKRKHDFANKYVITLHYRGTDKHNCKNAYEHDAKHVPYEFCSALVKKVIRESGRLLSDVVTFVATDEQPFVEHMKKEGVNAVFIDAIRSDVNTSGLNLDFSQCEQGVIDGSAESDIYNKLITQSVHHGMQEKSNYIKGLDVVVDAILLGSGNIFIRSRGNVSNQAYWIGGPTIKCIDLVDEFNACKKKKSEPGNDQKTFCD